MLGHVAGLYDRSFGIVFAMRSHLLVAILAMGACGGETPLGPFQPLPIDVRFDIDGNDGLIHIARDRFGVSHVWATTVRDLGFGQGYVMAHDRLAQMELLRRYASGTLAELYGRTDPSTIVLDREMRFHRLRRFAENTWSEIGLRTTLRDQQLADLLERFAAGVNTYVADQAEGKWPLDPVIRDSGLAPVFEPPRWVPWTPVDSVAIMKLYTFAQSWTAPDEIDLTELDVRLARTFSPALARDFLALQPIPTLGVAPETPPTGSAAPATRPAVPDALFASARAFFSRALPADRAQTLGPHALMRPFLGSTAFVIGADFTQQQLSNPMALLAADMQVAPTNPGSFYPMHQLIGGALAEDPLTLDILGLMLPGVPVALAGTNGSLGWAPTLGTHDINDVYLEPTTAIDGSFDEPIQIGDFGDIETTELVTFELVTAHGPIVPGRTSTQGLSVRSSSYASTHELSTMWQLGTEAFDVQTANSLLRQIRTGPHLMIIDNRGGYSWTSYADVPRRTPAATSWSVASPDAAAPFFILDGTNPAHDWGEPLPYQELPFISGLEPFIVVADDDPIDANIDGDPLNEPRYTGAIYANGLRDERIRTLLQTVPLPLDEDDVAAIQHDTRSLLAERIKAGVAQQLDAALATVPMPQRAPHAERSWTNIMLARDVLVEWNLATPVGSVSADASSGATLFFNTWMHYFAKAAFDDELTAAGYAFALDDDRVARIVWRMLSAPSTMAQHPVTNDPLVCGAGGCRALIVQAALSAVADLTADGSGRDDWRWGRRHALVLRAPFPDAAGVLRLPRETENMIGFQQEGDMFSIDRTDGGWADTDFRPRLGMAYRMQLVGSPIELPLRMRLELPTGAVLDTRDPHYRDLLESSYLSRTPFDVPFAIDDINDRGESRWELQ
jgi:penicillin G amidase